MRLSRRSGIAQVAAAVASALKRTGIRAVLTGGACATLYSRGAYQSSDLDFILQSAHTEAELDAMMRSIGFRRRGNHYEHAETPFFVEFPAGPLGIGSDIQIKPAIYRVGRVGVPALSPTDSCRDRLAAFYHWRDRQSLETAVAIARWRRVNLVAIRAWSEKEDALAAFHEFRELLKVARRGRGGTRSKPLRPRRHSSNR